MISLNHHTFFSFVISIVFVVLTYSSTSSVTAQQELKQASSPGVAANSGTLGVGNLLVDEDEESNNNLLNNKRGWKDVSGSWGKRGWGDLQGQWGKRGWERMNGAWGKRLTTPEDPDMVEYWNSFDKRPEWNKFKGSWGKRAAAGSAAGWSNLRGLWGKRSWNKLGNSWGKRSSDFDDDSSNLNEVN